MFYIYKFRTINISYSFFIRQRFQGYHCESVAATLLTEEHLELGSKNPNLSAVTFILVSRFIKQKLHILVQRKYEMNNIYCMTV